jgi:hypothetical protein
MSMPMPMPMPMPMTVGGLRWTAEYRSFVVVGWRCESKAEPGYYYGIKPTECGDAVEVTGDAELEPLVGGWPTFPEAADAMEWVAQQDATRAEVVKAGLWTELSAVTGADLRRVTVRLRIRQGGVTEIAGIPGTFPTAEAAMFAMLTRGL